MAKAIKCPVCAADAVERGIQDADLPDLWDNPYCPRCDKALTLEGLVVEKVKIGDVRVLREIGKGGTVIWEYPEISEDRPTQKDAIRFLRRILELEEGNRSQTSEILSLEQAQFKWNRKAASRRFRRWFRYEFANRPLEISDSALRGLATRILRDEALQPTIRDQLENEQKYFSNKLYDYESRASIEQPLIVSRLPLATRLMLIEAQDAFRFGLFRAVFAICRALLEDIMRQVVCRLPNAPSPIDDTRLDVLINCLPDSTLPLQGRSLAHEVRENGNAAVHDPAVEFDSAAASRNLFITTGLVQLLLEKAERRDK